MSTDIDEKVPVIDADHHDVEKSAPRNDMMTGRRKKSAAERRVILKQDVLIIPLLAFAYFFAYMVSTALTITIVQCWQIEG